MKRIAWTIALVLSLGLNSAWAEGNHVEGTNNSVRTIKSPRFARPLVEKWIEEYAKTEPGVEFQIKRVIQKTLAILFILESSPCCLSQPAVVRLPKCWKAST